MYDFSSVKSKNKLCDQPGEISLLLELLLHFMANLASRLVDFANFGEEGGDLVAAEKTGCPSLQQVTQAGLDGSWRQRTRHGSGVIDKRGEQRKESSNMSDMKKATDMRDC